MRTLLASLLLLASAAASAEVAVKSPWVAVLGGFMHLQNDADEEAVLTGASSADFARVEMHKTVHENGMARMLPQERIVIPANGSVMLEPGGLHLMLMEPKRALTAGDTVPLQLQLESGETVELKMTVRKRTGGGAHHHGH